MSALGTIPKWASDDDSSRSASSSKTPASNVWANLGVDPAMAKALLIRGFKTPTPIQRASIPRSVAIPPRDLLGMARTGSGKTLAYIIPLLQRLGKTHSKVFGPRALIMCPNRELALQILKVGKDLARGFSKDSSHKTDSLKWALIMGGEGLDDQFAAVSDNPDIIIATPGRFLHLLVEMNMDLRSIEMVIYDEADRLFEMGFDSQLREILHRLPASRQNLLFSATLPSSLAEFAKAGLLNPVLIRLDAEQKISPDICLSFFSIKPTEKDAALLVIIKDVLHIPLAQSKVESPIQAIVFVSTKHHVEYVYTLLETAGYAVSHIYGSLDQVARQRQMQAFRDGQSRILVVTDVAARGLDIPVMDNVINYDFPTGARVFVHRVGRTARAGRKGSAWSLVSHDDLPYVFDLERFLGQSLTEGLETRFGTIPRDSIDSEVEHVVTILDESNPSLRSLREVMRKGQSMFERSRGKASNESYKQTKAFARGVNVLSVHPIFSQDESAHQSDQQEARTRLLEAVKLFRPNETVFEVGTRGNTPGASLMKERRKVIAIRQARQSIATSGTSNDGGPPVRRPSPSKEVLEQVASTVKKTFQDTSFFLSHVPEGVESQRGYSLRDGATFSEQVRSATLDLTQDEGAAQRAQRASQLSWDRKKRKFVKGEGIGADNQKMIRGESGALLPATYQSGRFASWKTSNKIRLPRSGELENASTATTYRPKHGTRPAKVHDTELRSASDVRKKRIMTEQKKAKNARPRRK